MLLSELNPTGRFSDRVADYVRYRPSYPETLFDYLDKQIGGLKDCPVADVGAGTGIFSRQLLERGAEVSAVEPNDEMRVCAKQNLAKFAAFTAFNGKAEDTGLPGASVKLITCAQAYHWFKPELARTEFLRISKPAARVALVWNERVTTTDFGRAYALLEKDFGDEVFRKAAADKPADATFPAFFGPRGFETKFFDNYQDLDRDGLVGRFFSSSYSPKLGDPLRAKATEAIHAIFSKFQEQGLVRVEYKTELFLSL